MSAERWKSELKALAELSATINSSLDMQTVLDRAMACVQTFVNAEASAIFEVDESGGELFFRIALGNAAERVKEVRFKIGEGIAGWVAKTGEPIIVGDTRKDFRFNRLVDAVSGFETRSILCVPMTYRNKLIGVIQVLNKKDAECFDENDLEMVGILGNQVAIALENARLYTILNGKFTEIAEELKIVQSKLSQTERLAALAKLAQGVAHEVRNPVMVIGGFARRLLKQFEDNEPVTKNVGIILSETERLEQMVSDVEAFSRLRSPEPRPVDVGEVLKSVLQDLDERILSHDVEVKMDIPGELPFVECDEDLIALAMKNILLNALDAMPSGGLLAVRAIARHDRLVISIDDTGVGIPLEDLANVFDPFFTSKQRGSGLGLTTVHRIISEHSGEVKLSSVPGGGTQVRVCLPYRWREASKLVGSGPTSTEYSAELGLENSSMPRKAP